MSNYVLKVCDEKVLARANDSSIQINELTYNYPELIKVNNNSYILKTGEEIFEVVIEETDKDNMRITIEGLTYEVTIRSELEQKAYQLMQNKEKLSHSGKIKAPMPGLIRTIKKGVGDSVKIGESLLVFEAMKMENDLRATNSGVIKEIHVDVGDSVDKNQLLITIE